MPLPIINIPPPGSSFDSIVIKITSISNIIKVADSGLSKPLILSLVGSDGVKYDMLLKSKDDLRQDAVMQQLFSVCNLLFSNEKETRKRHLSIRTYNVIPLSPAVGIMEWVKNTKPFSELLPNYHNTYRPMDWNPSDITNYYKEEHGTTKQCERFEIICKNVSPVFHLWFLNNFSNPSKWFTARQRYCRSMASNSMVGFIVGIGDRHVGNILLDTLSGDVGILKNIKVIINLF